MTSDKFYLNRERGYHGRFKRVMARKKVCPTCGRLLWRKDFYPLKGKCITADCKECYRAKRRAKYQKKHKDGLYLDKEGRPVEYHNGHRCFVWSPQMISDLKRFYPTTPNEELAGIFMMSKTTVARKAKELGITKDKDWMQKQAKEHAFMGGYANKKKIQEKKRAYLSQASSSKCK